MTLKKKIMISFNAWVMCALMYAIYLTVTESESIINIFGGNAGSDIVTIPIGASGPPSTLMIFSMFLASSLAYFFIPFLLVFGLAIFVEFLFKKKSSSPNPNEK